MKNYKILIVIFLILFSVPLFANYLTITPASQNINTNSGTEVEAEVRINCYGNQNGFTSFNIIPHTLPVGYISHNPTGGLMPLGDVKIIKFKFKRTVSTTTTNTYVFRVIGSNEQGISYPDMYITINVTYNYVAPPTCNLPAPTNLNTKIIMLTPTRVQLSWGGVSGAVSYSLYVDKIGGGYNIYEGLGTTTIITSLEPNSEYRWQVSAVCPDGLRGNSTSPRYFSTLPLCPENIIITEPVEYYTSHEIKASNTIIAQSIITPNINVKFRAEQIILEPGFSVSGYNTGVFRAYVDPCAPSLNKIESEQEPLSEFAIKKEMEIQPILSPNPTKTVLNIDNIADISEWKLVDINGKAVEAGKINNSVQTKITINTSRLIPGVYYFNAVMKNGELFQKTVINK